MCATLDESPCPKVRICNSNLDCVKKLATKVQEKLGLFHSGFIVLELVVVSNKKILTMIIDSRN